MAVVDYRRQARILALQVLYELDSTTHRLGEVLQARFAEDGLYEQFASEQAYTDVHEMAARLVRGVQEHRPRVDALIQQYAVEWPFDKLAIIDRSILRMAIFELVIERIEPVRVVVNEAVDLAGLFGAENTALFINGVLGALIDHDSAAQPDRE